MDGALDFGRPFGVVLSRVRDSDDTVALNFFVFAEMLGVVEREASGVLVDDDREESRKERGPSSWRT